MKLLKYVLIYSAATLAAIVLMGITISFWCYHRFCDLDSRLYSPSAESVVRLTIDRSFDPPLSFTVIHTKTDTTLEACALPNAGSNFFTFSYVTCSLGDKEWKKIVDLIEKAEIPMIAHGKHGMYLDGSVWHISIARSGAVEKASIPNPDSRQDDVRYTSLFELGKMLNENADFITATERLY